MTPKFLYSSQVDISGNHLVAFPVYEANLKTGEIIAHQSLEQIRKTEKQSKSLQNHN